MLIIKWISSLALKNEWLCCANKLINYKLNFHLLWNCCFTGKKLKSLDKCAFFSTGQVASLTETCLMDRMLGSCSGHHRLWPLTTALPVPAPIRLLHHVTSVLSKNSSVHLLWHRDSEVFAHSWLAVASTTYPSVRIILMESCSAPLWSLQNRISKTFYPPDKGILRHC